MKVAVITRHAVSNYGSLLQTVATQRTIEKLGHSCEIIDYIREDENDGSLEKTLVKRKPGWNSNALFRKIYLMVRQPESIAAGKRFEKSRREYLHLTDRYRSLQELEEKKPEADVYLTGSDQVWGPVADGSYDSAYCLSFTDECSKRIAYAASFGTTDMNDGLRDYFRKWLSRYHHISVREDSAVEILKDMDIPANQVLDPTLLLTAGEWETYLEPVRKGKYVLAYQLHNDPKLGQYAKKVAKAKGLPLIRVSAYFHQAAREGRFVWGPSAGEFLSYIKNADCLITDSFHGTAFALCFNTPFVEVLPNNNTGTRNMSILKLTGLSHRILRDENNVALAQEPIDFTEANAILAEKRVQSMEILKQMIEE